MFNTQSYTTQLHILKDVYLFCSRWCIKYTYTLKLLVRPCKDWKCSILNTKCKHALGITLQWAMVMNGSFLAEYYSTESSIKLCTVHTLHYQTMHCWFVSRLIQHRNSWKLLFIVP